MAGGGVTGLNPKQSPYLTHAWCGECQEWIRKKWITDFLLKHKKKYPVCSENHRVRWNNHYARKRIEELHRY